MPTPESAGENAPHLGHRPDPAARRTGHVPEIDGLRGVAIVLIVIYHVWLHRVSGGVDVFFLLSGLLITMVLMRTVDTHGRIAFGAFYARIARRIFPPALIVLVGIVVASILWLPQSRWRETLGDVLAAAFYAVNWRLAENSVDYLASQQAASPVQHYWSLAVQAQFYLLWPVVILIAVLIASRLLVRPQKALGIVLGAVFASSLVYSIYRTATEQTYAYFDTFARLWEFALGGLLLLALPHIHLRRTVAVALGWVGLIALLLCGMVFRGGDEFPGWAALWPTLAASLLIITAGSGSRFGADRVLRATVLRRIGEVAYALYLWHWPVLICYLVVAGVETPTLRGGALVIVTSLALSIATRWLIERRLPATGIGQRTVRGSFMLAAGLMVAVLVTTAGWTSFMHHQQRESEPTVTVEWNPPGEVVLGNYPGAAYVVHGGTLPDVPYRPGPLRVRDDQPNELYPGCHQDQHHSEPILCTLGPEDADRVIAAVGGSRVQHWLPALERIGDERGWQIVAITKSACLFSAEPQEASCNEWNRQVMAELADMRPDAVFTTSTRVPRRQEETHRGYVQHWRSLNDLDIPVLAIRDVPRPMSDVPDCVEIHGPDAEECGTWAAVYGLDRPAEVEQRADVPSNVSFLDLTEFFCLEGYCPPVIGNVLVYHDNSHLTATYARTLAPYLYQELLTTVGW